MKITACLLILSLAAAGPVTAQDAAIPDAAVQDVVQDGAAATEPFQVVRLGDNQMSCEVLIAEINALNGQLTTAQNEMMQMTTRFADGMRNRQQAQAGMSAAMGLGGLAAAVVPGAALAMGAAQMVAGAGQRAAAVAQQNQTRNDMADMQTQAAEMTARLTPIMQRADHLTDISTAKGC